MVGLVSYSGIPRHADQQQIEFCIVAMVRISRVLSGRQVFPKHVSMIYVRSEGRSKFARFLGKDIEFGGNADEISFPAGSAEWALLDADPRLNKILLKNCEESLKARNGKRGSFRVMVENTIAPCFASLLIGCCETVVAFWLVGPCRHRISRLGGYRDTNTL